LEQFLFRFLFSVQSFLVVQPPSLFLITYFYSYSGMLKGSNKDVAPTFSGDGLQCLPGSGAPAEFETFSFTITTAPTSYFIRALFDEDTNSRATVRISTSAPSSEVCTGVVRGASSQSVAPSVQFVHWATQNGTYYVTIHLNTKLEDTESGLYALSITEANDCANTAELSTMYGFDYAWFEVQLTSKLRLQLVSTHCIRWSVCSERRFSLRLYEMGAFRQRFVRRQRGHGEPFQ